ncbi:MAG: (d)CMP kinase [Lewinellaceae bacterium]|nr:(d)CMP kinase [Lewinellaceae bacterium]
MNENLKIKKCTIAIDGYSACGKSTIAKQIAARFGWVYVDTGAMYRATTLHFLNEDVDLNSLQSVENALKHINISFRNVNGHNRTMLNGDDVEEQIRTIHVSNFVSEVSALSVVRSAMVAQQRRMGDGDLSIVMDGRDIGTVVFPDADIKFFITALPEVRAMRRFNELVEKGIPADLSTIASNLMHRDTIDSTREDSPLRQAEDAIVIDNSLLSNNEQMHIIYGHIENKCNIYGV